MHIFFPIIFIYHLAFGLSIEFEYFGQPYNQHMNLEVTVFLVFNEAPWCDEVLSKTLLSPCGAVPTLVGFASLGRQS